MKAPEPPRVFDEPWQAQAFALVVQLARQGVFTWNEWTQSLAAAIVAAGPDDGGGYYQSWLAALEGMTIAKGLTDPAILASHKADWARAYRTTPHGKPVSLTPRRPTD